MRLIFLYCLFLSFFISMTSANAALENSREVAHKTGNAVPFFRSKMSNFISGQASRSLLEEKILHTELEFSYQVHWDKKVFNLKADQIIREIQTARFVNTKANCNLLADAQKNARVLKYLTPQAELEIKLTDSYWAFVQERATNKTGWIPLNLLRAKNEDKGVFITFLDTYIRKSPRASAEILTTIPRLRRIAPLTITNGFLKIQYENQIGYSDINNFISRADFANLAYTKKKNWQAISYRDNDTLKTQDGQTVPIQDVLAYVTNNHRGIVINSEGEGFPQIRSRVEIKNTLGDSWAVSKLEGHGEVWWRKNYSQDESRTENTENNPTPTPTPTPTPIPIQTQIQNQIQNQNQNQNQNLSTDDLMQREIFSIAFEQKNSLIGMVSSSGVYKTSDGQTWTPLPQFEKNNYPVAINAEGVWFVGPYKSLDHGQTFEPYIRWDRIAEAIENTLNHHPRILRLTKIEPAKDSFVNILVDTGVQKVKLTGALHGFTWKVHAK